VNLSDIARRRLTNQHLVGAGLAKPVDVVATLGAVQAQDYAAAKWAIAQRMRDALDRTVEQSLIDGSIVRTHVLRPTWHFVAPRDIRWMLALSATRVNAAMAYHRRALELDDAVFRRSRRALTRALQGGKTLTRAELARALTKAGLDVKGEQRLGQMLMSAELDGIVCSGPRRAKQFTYALLDERIAAVPPIERDEALARLAKIYFETRGPATVADFAWWGGLTMSDARKGLELVGSNLGKKIVEGQAYWLAPSPSTKASTPPHAWLLPNFDEYFVAYRDRSAGLQRLGKAGIHLDKMSVLGNVVIVDGQLVGTWRRTLTKNAVVVEVNPLTPLTRTEKKAVVSAVDSYRHFLGSRLGLPQRGV
jgi:hypothetical protein